MPQHTSSEVAAGYNTVRFKCERGKDWNLIMTIFKKSDNIQTYLKSAGNI